MTYSGVIPAALVAALLAGIGTPASAADLDVDSDYVVAVHSRGYRHCHWVDGERICHRRGVPYATYYDDDDDWYEPYGYDYGYGYGFGPSIVLGFGGRHGGWGGHHGWSHGGFGGRHHRHR